MIVEYTAVERGDPMLGNGADQDFAHIHHREDETYYIIEGEFEFMEDDGSTFTAGAGSFVYLPKGRLHMHKNAGDTPARALVLVVPAGVDEFIEEAGEPA